MENCRLGPRPALALRPDFRSKCDWGQRAMSGRRRRGQSFAPFRHRWRTFVFGPLADPNGKDGFVFAFAILPTIIFMASFFAVLYHLGLMQLIIKAAAWPMTRLMGVSGAESLDVAASIFMGRRPRPR